MLVWIEGLGESFTGEDLRHLKRNGRFLIHKDEDGYIWNVWAEEGMFTVEQHRDGAGNEPGISVQAL